MQHTLPHHGSSTIPRDDQRERDHDHDASVESAFELHFEAPVRTASAGAGSSIEGLGNGGVEAGATAGGVLLRGRSNSCGPSSGYTRTRLGQPPLDRPSTVSSPGFPLAMPPFISPRQPQQPRNKPGYHPSSDSQRPGLSHGHQQAPQQLQQANGTLVMHWHGERPSSRERNASEHEAQKEKEKTELVHMILEAIANVPVAVERIHTNQKLCAALREEIGEENPLLGQLFDRRVRKSESDKSLMTSNSSSTSSVFNSASESVDSSKIPRGIANGSVTPSPTQHSMLFSPTTNGTILPSMSARGSLSPIRYATSKHQRSSDYDEDNLVDDAREDSEEGSEHEEEDDETQDDDGDSIEIDMLAESLAPWTQDRGRVVSQELDKPNDDREERSDDDEEQRDSSGFGSEYENDLSEAVNQLCMSPESLAILDKRTSSPIAIQNDLLHSSSFRLASASHSPQSSLCFGMSPGTSSQDGEPVSALWPRQPHQFAFTQEEEEEESGRQEDEVYSEVVPSGCSDEEDMEKNVFDMDEVHEHSAFAAFEEEVGQHEDEDDDDDEDGTLGADRGESDEDRIEREDSEDECDGDDGDDEEDDEEEDDEEEDEQEMGAKEYDVMTLRVLRAKNRTGFEPSQEFKPRVGSVVGNRYRVELAIGEAVFSRTYKCLDLETNKLVCLKIIKNNKEYFDQGIDEIRVMEFIASRGDLEANHLLRLLDYFYFREHLIIVTELLRDNLYEFSKLASERGISTYFTIPRVKRIAIEVLEALVFLHSLGLVHCDLKPENILISNFTQCRIKVIDFGSACFVTDELTSYVQSRSYRAPEVILGLSYNEKIDIWSLGCILAELITGDVLFQSSSEQSLLARINAIVGPIPSHLLDGDQSVDGANEWMLLPPTSSSSGSSWQPPQDQAQLQQLHQQSPRERLEEIVACEDAQFLDFLTLLLQIDPAQRPTATQALQHPFCVGIVP